MAKVLRMSNRARLSIKDVVFIWGPLSELHRNEVRTATRVKQGVEVTDIYRANTLLLKYTIKGLEGVEDYHGNPYELEFDENGHLTDDCVSEIRSIEWTEDYLSAAWQMLQGIPDKFYYPDNTDRQGVALELVKPQAQSG